MNVPEQKGRRELWVGAAAAAAAGIFALDWVTPLGYVVWILYLVPVLISTWSRRAHLPMTLAGICTGLIVAGLFLSPPDQPVPIAIFNRTLGVAVLWVTVWLLTRRKQVEEALRESEERYRTLFVSISEAFALKEPVFDDDGRIVDFRFVEVNPAFAQQSGLTDVIGKTMREVMPELEQIWYDRFIAVATTGQSIRFEERAGSLGRWFHVFASRVGDGARHRVVVLFSDITARKQEEAAFRESEERLRLALDAAQMGTFDWDIAGNRIAWSRWHEELWGYKPGEFDGTYKAFVARIHPDDLPGIEAELERSRATRTRYVREFRLLLPDGSLRWIAGVGEFDYDDDGHAVRMRGLVREFSEIKRLQQLSEDLRVLGAHMQTIQEEQRKRIARELHDELGSNLTALRYDLVALAKRIAATNPEAAQQARQMDILLLQTVDATRRICSELHPPGLEELGLVASLEWLVDGFRKNTGIEVVAELSAEDLPIEGERALAVFRICQEALTNVARYATDGCVEVGLQRQGDRLVLTVRDNGKGFETSPSEKKRSLGLVGMRERALVLGGTLRIDSRPGVGTTVTLDIPVQQSSP